MLRDNIRNIIFDMGEVLLPVTRQRCLENFDKVGFSNIDNYVGTSYKDGLFQQLELGNITENAFVEQVLEHCKADAKPEQIVDIWNSFIDPIPKKRLELILKLKKKYRILLLSNTNIIHWKYVCDHDFSHDGFRVDDHFDMKFLSFELHITKPDIGIFQIMIEESKIKPEDSLFIDDALKNCEAAESLGIRSYLAVEDNWMGLFE